MRRALISTLSYYSSSSMNTEWLSCLNNGVHTGRGRGKAEELEKSAVPTQKCIHDLIPLKYYIGLEKGRKDIRKKQNDML